jgi:hypothetical protein
MHNLAIFKISGRDFEFLFVSQTNFECHNYSQEEAELVLCVLRTLTHLNILFTAKTKIILYKRDSIFTKP